MALEGVLARPGLGDVHAEQGGDRTDGGDDQREDQAVLAEGDRAEDQRGDERHGVRLEQVGGHAGAVADVVTDVVGDRGGVARVVLGDAGLDLADQVGTDVGGLGEDAAAHAHEHREQGGAEAEALEHLGRVALVEEHDDRGTEQAQAHGGHADRAAGAEGDLHAGVAAVLPTGGRGDADVGLGGQAHAQVADQGGEDGADDEEDRASPADGRRVGGQQEEEPEDEHDEDAERLELAREVGLGAFLHGSADLLHLLGTGVRGQDLTPEDESHDERHQRDDRDGDDESQVQSGEVQGRARSGSEREGCHSILLDGCVFVPGRCSPAAGTSGRTLPARGRGRSTREGVTQVTSSPAHGARAAGFRPRGPLRGSRGCRTPCRAR